MKKIFVSYSHADEKWKNRLVKHLKVIQNQNQQSVWDDSQILAGGRWRKEIETVINAADGAILLISADFLTSDFILKEEIPRLLKRWENDELKIFPLIVEHCAWDQVDWLNKLQVRPKNAKPLSEGNESQINSDLKEFVKEVTGILSDEIDFQPEEKTSPEIESGPETQAEPISSQVFTFSQLWASLGKRMLILLSLTLLAILGIALSWYFLHIASQLADHLKTANRYLDEGKYDEAELHFKQAEKIDASNADVIKGLRKIQLYHLVHSDKDPGTVETEIQQFLKQNPDDAHAYVLLGDLFVNIKQDDAIQYYQKALIHHQDYAEAYFSLGYVHGSHLMNYDKALTQYQRAVDLFPRNIRYLTNLAGMLCKTGQIEKCINNYKKAIELHPYALLTLIKLIETLRLSNSVAQSKPYANELAALMEDSTVWAKPVNKEPWGVEVEDVDKKVESYPLEKVNEKQYYAFYQLSLSFFLLDQKAKIHEYAQKAHGVKLEPSVKNFLNNLIIWDLHRLKERRLLSMDQLSQYWNSFTAPE